MYTTYGGYGSSDLYSLMNVGDSTWTVVAFILAICGAICAYFLFVKPEKKYPNKFVNWLRSFLNFQEMLIEPILKVTYIFLALFITLGSFNLISYSFVSFLLTLILGNIFVRVIYEASMMMVGIWKNTKEINKKMK